MQRGAYRSETCKACLDVVDDLFGEDLGFGKVVEVFKAVVFEPEEVEASLVAGDEFLVGELPPATFGVLLGVPGLLALLAVGGVVAIDEIPEIFQPQRLALERIMSVVISEKLIFEEQG